MRFWSHAEASPERGALVEADGATWTAGELLELCNRFTHALTARGVRRGDSVAVLLPNERHLLAIYLAAMQSGWYLVPINHHLVMGEIAHIVADSDSKALVAHERYAATVSATLTELRFPSNGAFSVGEIDGCTPIDDLLDGASPAVPRDRTAGSVMFYTSGTTGRPKGVRRPLLGIHPEDAAIPFLDLLGLFGITTAADDVHLCASPLYHTAVLAFAASALHTGQLVVLMERFDAADMLAQIQRYSVTNSHMVPTQFHRLLALPTNERDSYDVSSLRYVIHGAAPCPIDVKRRIIEWWGPVVYEYYGTTEGGGTFVDSSEWLQRPGTVGRPWRGADIRILDDHGDELGPDEIGNVYIQVGPGFGYHNDEAKTSATRRGDYFTVGDLGCMDADGYLYLKDRSSHLIIAGGVNIYPAEIEGALLSHPLVADVTVFGVPHTDLGESVVAVVQPASSRPADDALTHELLRHCEQHLARFKIPRSFSYVERLPRDPSGKLPKHKVREAYLGINEQAVTSSP